MALQPLATVEQVGYLMQTDLPADDPTARFLLGWASQGIRAYLGQDITVVRGDRVTLTGHNGRLTLPQRPVLAVTKLERYDLQPNTWTEIALADYRYDLDEGEVYGVAGFNYYSGDPWWPTAWPITPRSMRVTYDHGLDEVPDGIAGVCASIAARLYNTPPGIQNERNGQRGSTFQENVLSSFERLTLGEYREARIR